MGMWGWTERMQIDTLPLLRGGVLIVLGSNKSVVEHYQVTPHVRWKQSGIVQIEIQRIWRWYATR